MELLRRLAHLFRKRDFDRDLEDEMRFHLEMRAAESGPPDARRRFGSPALALEDSRAAWGWTAVERLLQDLRFTFRLLRKNLAFSAVAILTLGVAIGANTLVFSLVDTLLLRLLPYAEPDRLAFLHTVEASSQRGMNTSYPDFLDWRDQSRAFSNMAAYAQGSANLTGAGEPERIDTLHATPGLFALLGIQPILGREFRADDEKTVALLTHSLWTRRFGADPGLLGRSIQLDGRAVRIVGICPQGFHFPPNRFSGDPDLFLPLLPNPDRTAYFLRVIGRLRPGASLAEARTEMTAVARRMAETFPPERRAQGVMVAPVSSTVVADSRSTALLLLGAVGFVLLIACANLANLLLSQGASRAREMAIRIAIGAGRARVIRQLLVESAVLGLSGGVVGLLLARAGLPLLVAAAPERTNLFNRIHDAGIHLDWRILLFTAAVSLIAAVLFGLPPAFHATRPAAALSVRRASGRFQGALLASEVALALILLAGAGLMIRTMTRLLAVDLGFRTDRLLTMEVDLPRPKYAADADRSAFFVRVLSRMESIPGVVSAAAAADIPLTRGFSTGRIRIGTVEGRAAYHSVSPRYLETMGIPLLRGRDFTSADTAQSLAVVIVNRQLADRYWPNADPLQQVLTIPTARNGRRVEIPLTVVGVVGGVRFIARDVAEGPEIYLPHTQNAQSHMAVVLRTSAAPEALAPAARNAIWTVDADQPVTRIRSMDALIATDLASRRFLLFLLGAFAGAALLLASIGIYGVVSYAVRQRTVEIGIRVALGAQRRDIAMLVFRQTLAWVLGGVAIGIAGASALSRLLTSSLYGVQPGDAPAFAFAALLLIAVAALANALPARRAMNVHPSVSLRYE